MYVIEATRNNMGHIPVCKEKQDVVLKKKKKRYEEWKCILLREKKSAFVLKRGWLFQDEKGETDDKI